MKTPAALESPWPKVFPEAWASDWGEDEIGLWMAFTFKGVRYAFRWIKPGVFMMGSPKNEPERLDRETQHSVTLTEGFWVGETTVTQALWQIVMESNPSEFKGKDLPVERVSWHDVQDFMSNLNKQQPDLNLKLPTEAQWEFACRAGSQTRFHFGEIITTDQVNFDGRYPPKGSTKGEYREKTVPVKALPRNDWGLYQMHGNVWEWCADWYGAYPVRQQENPKGPAGGVNRVMRGGSWNFFGEFCRSAFRLRFEPGDRLINLGFRLARGPR